MTMNGKLDQTDCRILQLLQTNARLDISQIASNVYKSHTATTERIRKLQDKGYIQRYVAVLNRSMIGRSTLMITLVKLNQHAAQTLKDFPNYMNSCGEVQLCLHLSGEYDFLLQVSLKNPEEYGRFLDEKLCSLPMVEKVQSSLVLKECKNYSPYEL